MCHESIFTSNKYNDMHKHLFLNSQNVTKIFDKKFENGVFFKASITLSEKIYSVNCSLFINS